MSKRAWNHHNEDNGIRPPDSCDDCYQVFGQNIDRNNDHNNDQNNDQNDADENDENESECVEPNDEPSNKYVRLNGNDYEEINCLRSNYVDTSDGHCIPESTQTCTVNCHEPYQLINGEISDSKISSTDFSNNSIDDDIINEHSDEFNEACCEVTVATTQVNDDISYESNYLIDNQVTCSDETNPVPYVHICPDNSNQVINEVINQVNNEVINDATNLDDHANDHEIIDVQINNQIVNYGNEIEKVQSNVAEFSDDGFSQEIVIDSNDVNDVNAEEDYIDDLTIVADNTIICENEAETVPIHVNDSNGIEERILPHDYEDNHNQINDDVSNSSSGNSLISNTSADAPTTSSSIMDNASAESSETDSRTHGVLKRAENRNKKKSVGFDRVTVYYFPRSQGFTCVPSQGGSTLGMDLEHCLSRDFTLESHSEERKRSHKEILLRQRRFAKMHHNGHLNPVSTSESEDESFDEFSDISDSELEADSCYFLQPVPIRQRRALLRASGVRKIEAVEKEECRDIRTSREYCGCECRIYCDPETCSCSLAGIKCQVDRLSFPCGCTRDGCGNLSGRIEFNPIRVRTHFIHTLMRIELEKKMVSESVSNPLLVHSSDNNMVTSSCYGINHNQLLNPTTCSNIQSGNSYITSIASGSNSIDGTDGIHNLNTQNMSQTKGHNDSIDTYGSPFSPDDSSYSENSDYTSDEFDESDGISTDINKFHESNITSTLIPSSSSNSLISSSSASLPPFPTISSNAGANIGVNHHNGTFISFPQTASYNTGLIGPQTFTSFVPLTQVYGYADMYQRSYISNSVGISQATIISGANHIVNHNEADAITTTSCQSSDDVQQYTDLSLSIASSSAVESLSGLLSSVNNSKDNRLTPVSLNSDSQRNTALNENHVIKENCTELIVAESSDDQQSTDQMDGESPQQEDISENFGEIIKTMVETVTA